MRKLPLATLSAGVMAFALAGPITAQEGASDQPTSGDSMKLSQVGNEVLNKDLKTSDGEDIGKIQDLVLDHSSGKIRYIVVSHGGALDVSDDLVVIPWNLVDTSADDLVVSVSKDQLAQAPSYSPDQVPNWSDPNYHANIIAFYEDPLKEAAQDRPIEFSALDVNNDGHVTSDELQRAMQDIQQIDQRFSEIDNDNSGDITQSEFAQFEIQPQGESGGMDSGGSGN